MNSKLVRPEYYDEDHTLNEQEFKGNILDESLLLTSLHFLEFNFVRIDPYWKTRTYCYSLSLNCFGDKESLIKRIDNLLFNNYLHKKPSSETSNDLAIVDIEVMVKNLKCSSLKFENIKYCDLEKYANAGTNIPSKKLK